MQWLAMIPNTTRPKGPALIKGNKKRVVNGRWIQMAGFTIDIIVTIIIVTIISMVILGALTISPAFITAWGRARRPVPTLAFRMCIIVCRSLKVRTHMQARTHTRAHTHTHTHTIVVYRWRLAQVYRLTHVRRIMVRPFVVVWEVSIKVATKQRFSFAHHPNINK